ncbi:MAG: hypothetical protein ACREJC_01595 [Tepidisphaeraceae bacterium]
MGDLFATPATIGEAALRRRHEPQRWPVDIHERSPLLHGIILAIPLGYAAWSMWRGRVPTQWFWVLAGAAVIFHLIARGRTRVRLTPSGLRLCDEGDEELRWEHMSEAHARHGEIELVMQDQRRASIKTRPLHPRDVSRLKKVIKTKFAALARGGM